MNRIYREAASEFDSGWYCGESVLLVIAKEMDIESEYIPAMATGFCSGMARTCGMCGAVSGAILALNLLYGRKTSADSVERNYRAVQTLLTKFTSEFGSTNCRQLLDCDLGTPEGAKKFKEEGLGKRCGHFTGRAAEITRKIIDGLSSL